MKKNTIKTATAKHGTELQEYLKTMRRHNMVPAEKGKGAKYGKRNRQEGKREALSNCY